MPLPREVPSREDVLKTIVANFGIESDQDVKRGLRLEDTLASSGILHEGSLILLQTIDATCKEYGIPGNVFMGPRKLAYGIDYPLGHIVDMVREEIITQKGLPGYRKISSKKKA